MKLPRWDLALDEMPTDVWEVWERWMAENPDHPAHRDQLACDIASLQMAVAGGKVEAKDMMKSRRREPDRDE